jgi:hypothetical protein
MYRYTEYEAFCQTLLDTGKHKPLRSNGVIGRSSVLGLLGPSQGGWT